MKKALFIYSTYEGQTLKILQTIKSEIKGSVNVELFNIKQNDYKKINLEDFDYILVASSIRYGHYAKEIYQFIAENNAVLQAKNANFLSVNLTARKEGKDNPATSSYIQKFIAKVNWKQENIVMFAGLLDYPRYKFLDKKMIQFIMWLTKGETDTSKTVEYTDWSKVKLFANKIKNQLS